MFEFKMTEHEARKHNIIAALVCVAGVVVNLVMNVIVTNVLDLPLYLDTIGTVAVAALGGYLPGVIVGTVTNILKSISDPPSLYYGVVNVLIAVAAAYIARRGWFKKIKGILGAVLIFALLGGGIGSVIPWYMEGLTFDSEALSVAIYETGYFNSLAAHVLSSLIMDLPDKAVSMLFVLGLL